MKKFKYKIETYLKYIRYQRDQALYEVKDAGAVRDRFIQKINSVEIKMKKSYEFNSQMGKNIQDINFVKDNNIFMKSLKEQLGSLSEELGEAERIYEEKVMKLLAMQRELKKLETHKENSIKDFNKKYKKIVQKKTDEINSTRHGSKNAKSV